MSENLKKFLVDLASDPERMRRYTVDAAGELDGAGLSADEKTALLGRDVKGIRRALNASPVDHMTIINKADKGGYASKPGAKKKSAKKKAKAGKKK